MGRLDPQAVQVGHERALSLSLSETRPRVGLIPNRPHTLDGMRMEPHPTLPGAAGARPAATAAAAPPLDPPADLDWSHGVRACGPTAVSVKQGSPNSGVAVLAVMTALTCPQ